MGDYVQRNKNTHLTLDLLIDIENCLDRNLKLKEIASFFDFGNFRTIMY